MSVGIIVAGRLRGVSLDEDSPLLGAVAEIVPVESRLNEFALLRRAMTAGRSRH